MNGNGKQEQAAPAGEPQQVVEKRRQLIELLASDANQVAINAVGGAPGCLRPRPFRAHRQLTSSFRLTAVRA